MATYPTPRMVRNYVLGRYFFRPAPLWLDFRVTTRCNHNCVYCGIPSQPVEDMTTQEVKAVIDKTKHVVNWVLLTGGECLLRPDIGEIVDYLKTTTDLKVTVNTNMSVLPDAYEKISRTDHIFFSIDGREQTHDTYRRQGSHAKVVEALDFLARRGTRSRLLSLTVLHRGTQIADLDHVLRLAEQYSFGPNFQLIRHYSASKRSREIDALNAHGQELLDYLIEQKRKGRFMTNTTKNLKILKDIAAGVNDVPCYSGRLFCYVTSEGRVALCFSRPSDDRYLSLKDEDVSFERALERLTEIRPGRQRCPGCTCTTPIELATFSFTDPRMVWETIGTFRRKPRTAGAGR
jgi:MoaA/NifB/PqqE/SkfB family radical SAM enzyme